MLCEFSVWFLYRFTYMLFLCLSFELFGRLSAVYVVFSSFTISFHLDSLNSIRIRWYCTDRHNLNISYCFIVTVLTMRCLHFNNTSLLGRPMTGFQPKLQVPLTVQWRSTSLKSIRLTWFCVCLFFSFDTSLRLLFFM